MANFEKIQERKVGDVILEVRIKQVIVRPEHKGFEDLLNIPRFEQTYRAGGESFAFREKIPKEKAQMVWESFKRAYIEIMEKLGGQNP